MTLDLGRCDLFVRSEKTIPDVCAPTERAQHLLAWRIRIAATSFFVLFFHVLADAGDDAPSRKETSHVLVCL